MNKGLLEAFSDGVLAIIITIMVLELKIRMRRVLRRFVITDSIFLSYVMSFVYLWLFTGITTSHAANVSQSDGLYFVG